jgi:hypothetical protein
LVFFCFFLLVFGFLLKLNAITGRAEHDSLAGVARCPRDGARRRQRWANCLFIVLLFFLLSHLIATEAGVANLHKLLLLILGCAIHCERREHYINRIKSMDAALQLDMMTTIKVCVHNSHCKKHHPAQPRQWRRLSWRISSAYRGTRLQRCRSLISPTGVPRHTTTCTTPLLRATRWLSSSTPHLRAQSRPASQELGYVRGNC